MRKSVGLKAALFGGSAALFLSAAALHGQITNPNFELPADGASGTDTVATGWTLNPAIGDAYTNPGQRCQFAAPTPSGGTWSFWLQTFVQSGSTNQLVDIGTITPGTNYNFGAQFAFEVPGYNNTTLANQASDTHQGGNGTTPNTRDLYSYLQIQWQNNHGVAIGAPVETDIVAGSVTTANHVYSPYVVSGVAPVGAYQALLTIGWNDGGLDGNTGGQSAFATGTDFFSGAVPEPTTLSLVGLGAMGLLARRRRTA